MSIQKPTPHTLKEHYLIDKKPTIMGLPTHVIPMSFFKGLPEGLKDEGLQHLKVVLQDRDQYQGSAFPNDKI